MSEHAGFGRLLLELGPRLAHAQRHALHRLDPPLSYRQYRILYRIDQGRTTLTALGTPGTVGLSTLSEIVDSLVRRGLVARTPSTRDRRAVDLSLTPDGRRVLEEADERLEALAARLTAGLSPAAQNWLTEMVEPLNATALQLLAEDHERSPQPPAQP